VAIIFSRLDHQGQAACVLLDQRAWSERKLCSRTPAVAENGDSPTSTLQKAPRAGDSDPPASVGRPRASAELRTASDSRVILLCQIVRERARGIIFGLFCLIVTAVSVHDAMLIMLHRDVIGEFEQNPIGRWLIAAQGGEVELFLLTKLLGTALACSLLVTLYRYRSRMALIASGGVACFQAILFWYLTFWVT